MSKVKRKSGKGIVWVIITVMTLLFVTGAVAVFFEPAETREINPIAFSRGSVNALGNSVESSTSVFTKEMFECVGLEITPDEEAEVKYQVFYYDADKNFLKSTAVMTEAFKNDYAFAKYARIVITPTGAETSEDDFRIGLLDVYEYAKMLSITVDREQGSIWHEVKVPVGANNRIRDCIYTGEYWCMVGLNGQLTYSNDAEQWVSVDMPNNGPCVGVAYGNGKYVVVDYDNGIYVSDKIYDGFVRKLDIEGMGHVVFSGAEFLVVGSEGRAYRSEDGENWTMLNKFTSSDLNAVIYANSQFVAVGQEGSIFVSDNLSDWYNYSIDLIDDIRTVYYDGSAYFIGGKDGVIMVSNNLSTWVEAVYTSSSDVRYVRDIVSHDGALFAASYTNDGNGEIWVSEDSGLTWNVVLKADSMLWVCESADGKLVVGGDKGRIFVME